MTTKTTLLTFLICAVLFTGCSKNDEEIVANNVRVARLITGLGNRYWHLKEIYLNNVMQTLTDYQKSFTKTYTIDPSTQASGTFTNSDNLVGTWKLDATGTEWKEEFISNGGQAIVLMYSINSVTETKMDVYYPSNGKFVREVYYAY
jgi:hypothetical protein